MTIDDDDKPGIKEKLRETFGSGSLTGGNITGGTPPSGGLGTGAGDMTGGSYVGGDVTSGGDEGVDTTGAGPLSGTDEDDADR